MKFAATIGCLHKIKIYYKCLWNCLFLSASKTLCSLCIRMLLVNVTSMWTLALNLSMNSGHLLGSQSNLRTSIGCKLRESIFFCRITLILLLVRLSALTTVSLPSVNSSMHLWLLLWVLCFYFLRLKINMGFRLLFRYLGLKYYLNLV